MEIYGRGYNPWGQNAPFIEKYATVAMLYCCGTSKIRDSFNDYPRYLNYIFGITDPIAYHQKLIAEGYYIKASPDIILETYRVSDLKDILAKNNLPTKGRRKALIEEILNNIDTADLNFGDFYTRSTEGETYLSKYEYVMALRNYNISPSEYDQFENSHPGLIPDEIIFNILSQRYSENSIAQKWGLARNALHELSIFYLSKNEYEKALYELISVLYIDTSGYSNGGRESLEQIILAPAILSSIYKYKEFYSPHMIANCLLERSTPQHYLSKNQFENLVLKVIDGKTIEEIDLKTL